jgi:hypothetical protein
MMWSCLGRRLRLVRKASASTPFSVLACLRCGSACYWITGSGRRGKGASTVVLSSHMWLCGVDNRRFAAVWCAARWV